MTSPCSGDKRAKDRCSNSTRVFFCSTVSGSSAGSATLEAIASSNSASGRRRRAESALWRAIASSQVETDDRASNAAVSLMLYLAASAVIIWGAKQYGRLVRRFDQEEQYRQILVEELGVGFQHGREATGQLRREPAGQLRQAWPFAAAAAPRSACDMPPATMSSSTASRRVIKTRSLESDSGASRRWPEPGPRRPSPGSIALA
jgi:hypothetical protein